MSGGYYTHLDEGRTIIVAADDDSHVRDRGTFDKAVRTLMMIDSLEMTAADRALIVEQCRQMNGRCFDWDRVRKNRETGVCEDI